MERRGRNPSTRTAKLAGRAAFLCLLASVCIVTGVAEDARAQIGHGPSARGADEEKAPGAPVALDDEATTDEGKVVDIAVLGNDSDPDGGALAVVNVTRGANGSVLVNGDDTVRYQPREGFTGLDGFAYTIVDGRGETATATVSVRVNDVADAPVAENQTVETNEDTALAIGLVASDADRDPLKFRIQRLPANGSLGGEPPDVWYAPNADYNGSDSFVFAVDDGRGGSDTGTVSIRIRAVADAPVALDDEATTDEGRVVDIAVLGNDSDPDGDVLRIVSVTRGANGWVLINGDETLRYQPNEGFSGLDGFAYTISDDRGETATATVSVRVNASPIDEGSTSDTRDGS
jgi:hypothetical protein